MTSDTTNNRPVTLSEGSDGDRGPAGPISHSVNCWEWHDSCALRQAKAVLEADQSTAVLRGMLLSVKYAMADHDEEPCAAPIGECLAVRIARRIMRGRSE